MTKACFLDRDGVLIVEKNYLSEVAAVELEQGAAEATSLLRQHGFKVIVVSNQAGVARGYFPEARIGIIHDHIDRLLAEGGGGVDAWYYCPHHPKGSVKEYTCECGCRKPEPGMLLQAAREHAIEMSESYMIGDKLGDLEAGSRAGCQAGVLVLTGHGEEIEPEQLKDVRYVARNILDAVKIILGLDKES